MTIEVVYTIQRTKKFRGKDALKQAKKFSDQLHKNKNIDEVLLWNIENEDGTNGYWERNRNKTWGWNEMDG